jgi:pimeloyl-ACP methyl ester carboxylesterase
VTDQHTSTPTATDDDEPTAVRFRTRSGLTLTGDAWGTPDRRAVVLIHGGGQTRHSWGSTAAALARSGWYAVTYDQRGHGTSDRAPDRDYANSRFAEDCVDVCAELTAATGTPPVAVGASLGGLSALVAEGELAAGTTAALVLVDITPRMEPDGVRRIVGFMLDKVNEGFGSLDEAADAVAAYQPHRPRPRDLTGLSKNLRLDPDGRWRWHWDPDLFLGPRPLGAGRVEHAVASEPGAPPPASPRYEAAARSLAVPTLLVRGRMSDLVSVETAEHFRELVPHAEYVDVSGAGHMVAGDRNDAFTAAVAEFLARLD